MSSKEKRRHPYLRRFMPLYLLALAISWIIRLALPADPPPSAGLENAELLAATHEGLADNHPKVRLAYHDSGAPTPGAPVLVLLHGSPMAAERWDPMVSALREAFRVIVPQLNGSGASEPTLPDYSAAANARHVGQLLAALEIEHYHLAGFSTGATAALHLGSIAPGQVRSLYLMSPLAIEELELVGDQTLNRTIYWAQKFYIWCGLNLIPHFGLLDRAPADMNYARHYHQTDPRRLDAVLRELSMPVALMHGEKDRIRPAAASSELARRLPHAELELLPGGRHGQPLEDADTPARLAAFIMRVESGAGQRRAAASAERVAASHEEFTYTRYREDLRGRVILMVVLLAIATLISEDITCITAGILASRGMLGLFPATFGCFMGIVIGDVGLYLLGRVFGQRALRAPPLRWLINEDQVHMSERFFARYGALLVIVTRWLPGMRIPTYVAAGMLKLRLRVFLFYFIIAAAVWTPLLVGLSTIIGDIVLGWLEKVEDFAPFILLGFILCVWFAAKVVMTRATRAFEKRAQSK